MNRKSNTVNIERRYHHGDLRAALIEVGLRLLAEKDVDGLALREVAREVGVSPTAVYRHFPDRQALMIALAQRGLEKLGEEQREASAQAGGGTAGFAATGRAYVRFALGNPALFRLIFTSSAQVRADSDGVAARLLHANAAARLPSDADAGSVATQALSAWALVHGLAMLMLDGQVPADDAIIDRLLPVVPAADAQAG